MPKLLLLNAGSSSLKCTVVDSSSGNVLSYGVADWAGPITHYHYSTADGRRRSEDVVWKGHAASLARYVFDLTQADDRLLADSTALAAVGHRIVHGGPFTSSVLVTPEVRQRIQALADLAPLHNPPSLETLAAAEAEFSLVPHVAVFDTSFHATLAPEASTYPVPEAWTREWGIRRYGFHGLSHAYCARRAAEMLRPTVQPLRLVICHLGHGCSASAVRGGRCVDTTMGFTPLEGLMMATRSGSIDPSIVFYVQRHHGLSAEQAEQALNRQSGLLGVSGVSADMRQVLAAAKTGHAQSELALGIYTHRARSAVGALAVASGGIDALVFTAGVGERSAEIRAQVCSGLEWLGLELDAEANTKSQPDADIATSFSRARILIIATREDVTMLREVNRVLESTINPTCAAHSD